MIEELMCDGGQARWLTAQMAAGAGMNDLSRVASEMFERPVASAPEVRGMRVLLVEDDPMIGNVRAAGAARRQLCGGLGVRRPRGADHARRAEVRHGAARPRPAEEGRHGGAAARSARAHNDVPVLVLTARDATEDRVAGLDGGADDYLVKPFAMSELLARMRAVTRRKGSAAGPRSVERRGRASTRRPTKRASAAPRVRLTAREFSLLQSLLLRPGAILSRAELEHRIYGWNEEVESNAVEFLIHALRKKLGSDTIKNVRGVGWMVSKER